MRRHIESATGWIFVFLLTLILVSAVVEAAAKARAEEDTAMRACKLCATTCCPDKRNCSCLHTDACNCTDPTTAEAHEE